MKDEDIAMDDEEDVMEGLDTEIDSDDSNEVNLSASKGRGVNLDARRRIEELLEQKRMKELLGDDYYY